MPDNDQPLRDTLHLIESAEACHRQGRHDDANLFATVASWIAAAHAPADDA